MLLGEMRQRIDLSARDSAATLDGNGSKFYDQLISRTYFSTLQYFINNGRQGFSQDSEINLYAVDKWLETSVFLSHMTAALNKNDDIRSDKVWEVFRNPLLLLEFKLSNLNYSSWLKGPAVAMSDKKGDEAARYIDSLDDVINVMSQTYLLDVQEHTTDKEIATTFRQMFANDAVALVDHLKSSAQTNSNVSDGETASSYDATGQAKNVEDSRHINTDLKHLLRPLADHIVRHYSLNRGDFNPDIGLQAVQGAFEGVNFNTFNRTALKTWRRELENAASGGDANGEADPLIGYPYVSISPLAPNSDYALVVVVTQLDNWFLDERVKSDHRLPNIVMGVYDTRHMSTDEWTNSTEMQAELINAFSGITNKLMAYNRGRALGEVAGEAADISRFWYGEGVMNLLGQNQVEGGLDTIDVFDFWSDFVRELLCADIPGVDNTEIFPFDRAYIINHSGVDARKKDDESKSTAAEANSSVPSPDSETYDDEGSGTSLRVRVLEAALQSRAAEDRFRYLTVLERGERPLDEFILTKKIIQEISNLGIQPHEDDLKLQGTRSDGQMSFCKMDFASTKSRDLNDEDDISRGILSLLGAAGLLNETDGRREVVESEADRKFKKVLGVIQNDFLKRFDEEGFFYEYRHGLTLSRDAPGLYQIDRAYKSWMKSRDVGKKRLSSTGASGESNDVDEIWESDSSKVVYISYDPGQSALNKGEDGELLVPLRERFSLVLVADVEPPKSELEMRAERKDLELLIRTILRQRMRDKKREFGQVRKRIGVVENFVDSFLHRIKGLMEDEQKKQIVQQQWSSLRQAMQFDSNEKESFNTENLTTGTFLEALLNKANEAIKPGQLMTYLEGKAQSILNQQTKYESPRKINIDILETILPPVRLTIPATAVMEAFDVMFKNAVEAAASPSAPANAKITIQALSRPSIGAKNENEWSVEVVVVNTTEPLDSDVLTALRRSDPVQLDTNAKKSGSTGAGVFASRSQLRFGLGRDADIRYMPIGTNLLQAALSLPGHLIDIAERGRIETEAVDNDHAAATAATLAHPYILYIEDDEKNYLPSLATLNKAFEGTEIKIEHVRDLESAQALFRGGLPLALLADYNFLAKPEGSHAAAKNGDRLLISFMDSVTPENKPPIWVVSDDDSKSLAQVIGASTEDNPNAYTIEVVESYSELGCNPGTLQVSGMKNFAKYEDVIIKLAQEIGHAMSPAETFAPQDLPQDKIATAVHNCEIVTETFDAELSSFVEKFRGKSVEEIPVFVAHATYNTSLPASLKVWFNHDGVVDLDSHDDKRLYRLFNGVYHHRFVCKLAVDEALFNRLSPRFLHWCISKNVVITPPDMTPEALGAHWSVLRHEGRGALGRIRHDVKNIRSGLAKPARSPRRTLWDIEDITTECENHLSLGKDKEDLVFAALTDGKVNAQFKAISELDMDRATEFAPLKTGLVELRDILAEARDKLVEPGSDTSHFLNNQHRSVTGLLAFLFPEVNADA